MNKSHHPASWRRRDFLRASARTAGVLTAANVIPLSTVRALGFGERSPFAHMTGADTSDQLADTAFTRQLVQRAIDAARSAGARYAEARVTRTVTQGLVPFSVKYLSDHEYLAIGVRALVDGAWGFAASTYWELDEATALARDAVEQARINASVFPQDIDLGTYPAAQGEWVTPIRIDPFQIPIEQKMDFLRSFDGLTPRHIRNRRITAELTGVTCIRQERTTATSEGALFSQTLYNTGGKFLVGVRGNIPGMRDSDEASSALGRGISSAGAGWERILDAKLHDQIPGLIEEAEANLFLPHKPVDVGRYEIVMPADVVASFVSATLGNATQLDRAMGLEANAGGTSYLGPDPEDHLGTALGSSLMTLTANRSQPQGLATVKWDDEGVEPDTFSIMENGVVVDYQTTRESAAWIAPWYRSRQRAIRSHGCAVAPSASDFPMQHTPNLQLAPGAGSTTFADMIQNTKRGIAFTSGLVGTDFQSRTGQAGGTMREIIDGKLGPVLDGASILFDSTQLWKNLIELGGASSVEIVPSNEVKGQPAQASSYSIQSVAGRFKDLTVVDGRRKG